jgi:hypothetical protein
MSKKEHTMTRLILTTLLICAFGCTGNKSETPSEAASTIGTLLKNRDYTTLFQERYSEWHKVETEGIEPEAAIAKLSGMFEKNHEMLVAMYDQLATADYAFSQNEMPQTSETGEIATATISVNGRELSVKLYKMTNGRWGFHL